MSSLQPADRIEAFTVTVPARTTAANPQRTNLVMRRGDIVGVELKVPPGHLGLTGFALGATNERLLPRNAWIVANDEEVRWALDPASFPDRAVWQAFGYNTDVFPHSFYLRLLIAEYPLPDEAQPGRLVPLLPL